MTSQETRYSPVWWNWQTRRTQNPMVAIPCRFDPDYRHQKTQRSIRSSVFFSFSDRSTDRNSQELHRIACASVRQDDTPRDSWVQTPTTGTKTKRASLALARFVLLLCIRSTDYNSTLVELYRIAYAIARQDQSPRDSWVQTPSPR